MLNKIIKILETHVGKIIWIITAVLCLWLFVTHVAISPNKIEFDGKNFTAGQIDDYILSEHTRLLEDKLNEAAKRTRPYKPRYNSPIDSNDPVRHGMTRQLPDGFLGLAQNPLSDSIADFGGLLPDNTSIDIRQKRIYRIPSIVDLNGVAAEHIRAVAYVPTEKITPKNTYKNAQNEAKDIDMITVEASFNLIRLYENFKESFDSEDIKTEWRDPYLAKPVFAAVQLERQQKNKTGTWTEWKTLSRTKIDSRTKLFNITENVKKLPAGGIEVQILKLEDADLQADILQPEIYQIASPRQFWFPPNIHKEFIKNHKEIELRRKRQKRDADRDTDRERERTRDKNTDRNRERTRDRDRNTELLTETRSNTRPVKEIKDFENLLHEISIRENSINDMSKLTFWAHDDTVKPDNQYRYRMRLGVFNPIAGMRQCRQKDKELENKVILWSNYSDITDVISIPKMIYIFPHNKESAKSVTVQISKYSMGYWVSRDFSVKPGELIGKAIETVNEDEEENDAFSYDEDTAPQVIDFSTGALLVDLQPVSGWSGTSVLRERHPYFNMIYSFDEETIQYIGIKIQNWPLELRSKYQEIKNLKDEPREELRSFD